jgi:AcrR family transcriptional regulator
MAAQPIRDVDWTAARDIRRELESDTKDALIAAARQVFSTTGYASATIANIATAAEVSRPTFYVYFATKAEVFRVVASQLRDELLDAHHHPRSVADDPVLLSRASVEAFVDLYVDNLELLDEIDKRSAVDQTVAGLYDDMVGKPMRRTHRHITRLREAGVAHPLVEDEYAAHLMRTGRDPEAPAPAQLPHRPGDAGLPRDDRLHRRHVLPVPVPHGPAAGGGLLVVTGTAR